MPAPDTIDAFLELVRKSNQVDPNRLDAYIQQRRQDDTLPPDPKKFAVLLVREGLLTNFQAEQFLQGRYKGFNLGGYRILERLGQGGTGTVYLAEHEVMKRRVALKVVPPAVAADPGALERFRREAQAAAVLDHPNIVRAYDFRQEGQLHVLVMEYVNGPSLEQVMQAGGPMSVPVACEYIRQAAAGLEHAHEQGMVHRDIKPGNLLVDPTGLVKILDMGLARFSPEGQESVTKKFDEHTVMGTADYLAPEQAINLHDVDARADIYSLGATLYALLTGAPPFAEGTVTQKLLWHQMREPTPLRERQADVPPEVARIVAKMMAKDPAGRFQNCAEVLDALSPFSATTPTGQGPARPGEANGRNTSASFRRTGRVGPSTSSTRMAKPAPAKEAVSETPKVRLKEIDDDDRPRRRRREGDVRQPSGSHAGIIALIGVMVGIVLLVVGVIAFLMFGPAPTVTSSAEDDAKVKMADVIVKAQPPVTVHQPPQLPPQGVQAPAPPLGHTPEPGGAFWMQPNAHKSGVNRIAFASDGSRLVTCGQEGTIKLWDLNAKKHVADLAGHNPETFSVCFWASGTRRVLSAGGDKTAKLWEVGSPAKPKSLNHNMQQVKCAIFGRTENDVITGGVDNIVRLFDGKSGKSIKPMYGHKGEIAALAYCVPQNHVVSASFDKTLNVYDLGSKEKDLSPIKTLTGHTAIVSSVAVTADGKFAVSGSFDGSIKKWDLLSGKDIVTLNPKSGNIWAVAVSPDGRFAASGGADKVVRVWDLQSQTNLQTFQGHSREITSLAFSQNGKYLASSSLDRTFRVWPMP